MTGAQHRPDPHALWAWARQALAAGRLNDAAGLFRHVCAAAPEDPAGWVALAETLLTARRAEAAAACCDEALGCLPDHPDILVAKALALEDLGRLAPAAALLDRAAERIPGHAGARQALARRAVADGRWGDAATHLRQVRGPAAEGAPQAWLAARIALGEGDLERARRLAAALADRPDLRADDRAEALLLLGEALDRLDQPQAAFAAFARGKALLRAFYRERASGREGEVARLTRLAQWLKTPPPRAPTARGVDSSPAAGHVFLLGFPRSGSTLIEQALAGSPDVLTVEEGSALHDAGFDLIADASGLATLPRLAPAEAQARRRRYWAATEAFAGEVGGRIVVDKQPGGGSLAPLIPLLFPRARTIIALRDPRDVVLSCFRHAFQMNALTYAFTDLAQTARAYGATMTLLEACQQRLGLETLTVRHEALVADFSGELRRLCAFVGARFEGAMIDVAATAARRTIRTPSAPQVRAGLNAAGVGRWRAYAAELAPALPILEPWIERLGYPAA